jgi:peptide/nickel transport system permease protein
VLILAITLTGWVQYARTVRGSTLVERNKEYVQAARVTGVARLRIMRRHVLPNVLGARCWCWPPSTSRPPSSPRRRCPSSASACRRPSRRSAPSSASATTYLFSGEWWITVFPGVMLILIALSINLLGDWLRDALNPRLR